ncbi:hypothetical protein RIF29_27974 [Crotalaria pallida]|uniref:Uncharacterized protein n=1 Tax=Crotalaria pallida TaxID=3830 RepID=A0AAN9ER15_CROPI
MGRSMKKALFIYSMQKLLALSGIYFYDLVVILRFWSFNNLKLKIDPLVFSSSIVPCDFYFYLCLHPLGCCLISLIMGKFVMWF